MLTPESNIRYDIVFLRCLAVVSVVCFHFELPLFNAGYAGVDVFFVLSGFLMTQIITGAIQAGKFDVWNFYYRRLARVLPALLFVILFFLLLVYAVLGIKLYDFSRFALTSSIFVSNIHYYQASGYFAPSSQLNFLLHTWSLSVEWQFYISYPLLWMGLTALFKKKQRASYLCLHIVLALSFLCMLYYVQHDQSFAFYMFPTRAWELLAGGLAFSYGRVLKDRLSPWVKNVLGILLLQLLFLTLCDILPVGLWGWPSALTLLPVCITAAILVIAPELHFFTHRVPVFIARISYTWYLWHWPIVVFCSYFAWNLHLQQRFLFFVGSFIVSTLAYLSVEKPVFFRKPVVLAIGLSVVGMLTFSFTQVQLSRMLRKDDRLGLVDFLRTYPVQGAPRQYNFDVGHLLANSPFTSFEQSQLVDFSDSTANYLLLGDCHAGMFSATLRRLAKKNKVHLFQATGDETFPVAGIQSAFQGPTDLMNYMYSNYLPAHIDKIDKVIIAVNYAGYSKKQLANYMAKVRTFFASHHVPVVYIGQTERYRIEFPVVAVLVDRFGLDRRDFLDPARHYANQYLKQSDIAAHYIDVYDKPFIDYEDGKQTYFYDADHLSLFGTEQYADLLESKIFLAGSLQVK